MHRGHVIALLLVAARELGQLVFDATDLAQPQNRATADDLAFRFHDAAGERGHGHGEAHAARPQRVDGAFHVAGRLGVEPGAERQDPMRRVAVGHLGRIADDLGIIRGCRPGDENLRLGQQQRIGTVDRGPRSDALIACGGVGLGQAAAGSHQQDRCDDGKAEHAEGEGERRELVAVKLRECLDVSPEQRRLAGRVLRQGRAAGRQCREGGGDRRHRPATTIAGRV